MLIINSLPKVRRKGSRRSPSASKSRTRSSSGGSSLPEGETKVIKVFCSWSIILSCCTLASLRVPWSLGNYDNASRCEVSHMTASQRRWPSSSMTVKLSAAMLASSSQPMKSGDRWKESCIVAIAGVWWLVRLLWSWLDRNTWKGLLSVTSKVLEKGEECEVGLSFKWGGGDKEATALVRRRRRRKNGEEKEEGGVRTRRRCLVTLFWWLVGWNPPANVGVFHTFGWGKMKISGGVLRIKNFWGLEEIFSFSRGIRER